MGCIGGVSWAFLCCGWCLSGRGVTSSSITGSGLRRLVKDAFFRSERTFWLERFLRRERDRDSVRGVAFVGSGVAGREVDMAA